MKLAIFGLSGILLSACSNSPSITLEDQVKLQEYKSCLEIRENIDQRWAEERYKELTSTSVKRQSEELNEIIKRGLPDSKTGLLRQFEEAKKVCAIYLP